MLIGKKRWSLDAFTPKHVTKAYIFIFFASALIAILAEAGYIWKDNPLFLTIPFVVLLTVVFLLDLKLVYLMLWASIPISIQYSFNNGLSTDLPSEPLIVLLMIGILVIVVKRLKSIPAEYILHPISLILLLHFVWVGFTVITADNLVIAIKFFLAKSWYIVTFYVGTLYLLKDFKDYKGVILSTGIPLTAVVVFILIKHALNGFTFLSANFVIYPFFRNHVDYASLLVIFLPFIWFYYRIQKPKSYYTRIAMVFSAFIMLLGIFFSYTRAAFVSLGLMIVAYYVIRHRMMRYFVLLTLLLSALWVASLVDNNRYLKYAPNFEQTVAHKDFESLLSATYKLRDISTMERVYRWVAGFRMVAERPWMGVGPNGFYSHYRSYTIRAFETYVSDNPEKSGIHNYYLMTAVEQGIPGMIFFLLLSLFSLLYGERLYYKLKDNRYKLLLMSALLSHVAILSILLINDMIETVKVGPVFFFNLAIIVGMDIKFRNKKTSYIS